MCFFGCLAKCPRVMTLLNVDDAIVYSHQGTVGMSPHKQNIFKRRNKVLFLKSKPLLAEMERWGIVVTITLATCCKIRHHSKILKWGKNHQEGWIALFWWVISGKNNAYLSNPLQERKLTLSYPEGRGCSYSHREDRTRWTCTSWCRIDINYFSVSASWNEKSLFPLSFPGHLWDLSFWSPSKLKWGFGIAGPENSIHYRRHLRDNP